MKITVFLNDLIRFQAIQETGCSTSNFYLTQDTVIQNGVTEATDV